MRTFGSVLLLLLSIAPSAVADEATAKELEQLIMAPCCGKGTVADHVSPASDRVRREVREMLSSGMSRQAILDHYVAQHGETILAMPPARGFNLVAYTIPMLGLLIGLPLLALSLRSWRKSPATPADSIDLPVTDLDAADYEKRLARQLANLD